MSASPAGGTPPGGGPGGRPSTPGMSHNINPKSKAFIQRKPPVKKYKPGEFPPGHPMYNKQWGPKSTPPKDDGTNAPGQNIPAQPIQARQTGAQALLAQTLRDQATQAQATQAQATEAQTPGAQATQAQPARAPQRSIFGDLPHVDKGGHYEEYSIFLHKGTNADGTRYHTMKFISKLDRDGKQIFTNPFDEKKFTRPVSLLRHSGQDEKQVKGGDNAASGVDDKEREIVSAKRAERQAQREANQAQIAPADDDEAKKAQKKRKIPKTQDIYYDDNSAAYKARAKLRHEEKKPWHLEDFEGKSKHIGTYIEGLSNKKVLLVLEGDAFRMIPVEKAYKFAPTGKFKPLTCDQAEAVMNKKFENPRWFMKSQDEKEVRAKAEADDKRREMKLKWGEDVYKDRLEEAREQARIKRERDDDSYRADRDELDFDAAGEFDDDDAGLVFGEDEAENKETEKRIREEQRHFNLPFTGLKEGDDKDWDAEEREEKLKHRAQRRAERKTKKRLMKREGNFNYQDDDDSDAKYDDSSDESSDSDFEDDKKVAEDKKIKAEGSQSGSSTKGTNTPSGRLEKHGMSKSLGASLKRPGSPNLSDASSNGTGRKKIKVNGKDSDTDSNRAGRPTKKTVKQNSPPGSPPSGSATASRAGSPAPRIMPTAADVKAAIPAEGIAMSELIAIFRPRLPTAENVTKDFITLVKQVAWQHPIKGKAKSASKLPKEAYDFQIEIRIGADGKPSLFVWPLKHVADESEESDEDEEDFVDAQERSDEDDNEDDEEFFDAQGTFADVDEELLVGDSGEEAKQKEYSDVDKEVLVGDSGEETKQKEYSDVDKEVLVGDSGEQGRAEETQAAVEKGEQGQKKVTIKKGLNGKVVATVSTEATQPAKTREQLSMKASVESDTNGKTVSKVPTEATQPAKMKRVNKLLSPKIAAEKAKLADKKTNATDATEDTPTSKKRKANDTETTGPAKHRKADDTEATQSAIATATQPAIETSQPAIKKRVNKLLSPKIAAEKAKLADKKTNATDATEATPTSKKRKANDTETTGPAKHRKADDVEATQPAIATATQPAIATATQPAIETPQPAIEATQPAIEAKQPAVGSTQRAVEVDQPAKKPANKLLSPKITAEKVALAEKEKMDPTDTAEATTPAKKRKADDDETTESAKKRKVEETTAEESTETTPAKKRAIKKLKGTPKTIDEQIAEKEARAGKLEDKEKTDLIEELARDARKVKAARAASDAQIAKKHKMSDDDKYDGPAAKKIKPSPLSDVQTFNTPAGEMITKPEPPRVYKKPLLKRPTLKDAAVKAKVPQTKEEKLAKKADDAEKEKMDVIAEFAAKSGETSGESRDSTMTHY